MKLGVVLLKKGQVFNREVFANVNLEPLAMADANHFLVRIDDDTRTAESITAEADFVESIEMITGHQKKQLLATYCQHGSVSIAVTS